MFVEFEKVRVRDGIVLGETIPRGRRLPNHRTGTTLSSRSYDDDTWYVVEFCPEDNPQDCRGGFSTELRERHLDSTGEFGWQYHRRIEFPSKLAAFEKVRVIRHSEESKQHYGDLVGRIGYVRDMTQLPSGQWLYEVQVYGTLVDESFEIPLAIMVRATDDALESLHECDDEAQRWWTDPPSIRVNVEESGFGQVKAGD